MSDKKITKIKYIHNGIWKEEGYESDGYDQINGVLEGLASRYVPASSVPREVFPKPDLPKRDLTKQGITKVYVMFEDSDWLEIDPKDLFEV
ncbi:hypothetical protein [Klebsiella quasivariicola]|uniref:hypothetical protein n=1 Tax=Klebsiella quasivariicola TaxID=2026240 RepID=UPI001CCFFB3A|nr:hypothetical protein [Klebsiella quasivariicola]MBZ9581860.1 hypothetical protein [Klebsiella quasivariicola]